jgi:8-oxo-dGTP diphosphatase
VSIPEVCVVYLLRSQGGVLQVLLGRKQTGLGVGKVVAPGGKLEGGETPRQAAVREVGEEVGIAILETDLVQIGELTYPFPYKPEWTQKSWVFLAVGDFNEPVPSAELQAEWTPMAHIPLHEMWDDARYWLPSALRGRPVVATFVFGRDLSTVVESDHPSFSGSDVTE